MKMTSFLNILTPNMMKSFKNESFSWKRPSIN